jgi:NACHT domain
VTALEVAAVELGFAVVKAGCNIWLGDTPLLAELLDSGSRLIKDSAVSLIQRRHFKRFIDDCADVIAGRIENMLKREFTHLPENEREACIHSVGDTFQRGRIDQYAVVRADLDPKIIELSLEPASKLVLREAGLSEAGTELYRFLLKECCAYLAQFVRTLPEFDTITITELLRRQTDLKNRLEIVLDRLQGRRSVDDFSTDYRRQLAFKLDRMELFGVRVGEASRDYPLSIAYISLHTAATEARDYRIITQAAQPLMADRRPSLAKRVAEPVEVVLARSPRLLITGEAGSGKTTLLRWLAVRCARQDFREYLSSFNGIMPFYIRLREYVDRQLPAPEDFIGSESRNLAAEMPPSWVHAILRDGNALVLIDGIDELSKAQRTETSKWLKELVYLFPNTRYVITSRPEALAGTWPEIDGFVHARFDRMTPEDTSAFIHQWHQAVAHELRHPTQKEALASNERALKLAIDGDRHLRQLAVNPLLCALLCALNREMRAKLPRSRMEVYEAALDMLLEKRDRERGLDTFYEAALDMLLEKRDRGRALDIAPLSKSDKMILLQHIALWLIRNGKSDASTKQIIDQLEGSLPLLRREQDVPTGDSVLQYLIERSRILRSPIEGRIDFIHKTFQEYLAGKAAMESDAIGELVKNAEDDHWREVIVMAAGHAQPRQRTELLDNLLARSESQGVNAAQIDLLTVACLQTARELDPELRRRIEHKARDLMPPRDMEVAEALATAGDFVLDLLPRPTTDGETAATVRTVSLLGGDGALHFLERAAKWRPQGLQTIAELLRGWDYFDPAEYGVAIAPSIDAGSTNVEISQPSARLRYAGHFESLRISVADMYGFRNANVDFNQIALSKLKRLVLYSTLPFTNPGASAFLDVFNQGSTDLLKLLYRIQDRKAAMLDVQDFEEASAARAMESILQGYLELASGELFESLFPNLLELCVQNYPLRDLYGLSPLRSVETLELFGCVRLTSFSGIDGWQNLRTLAVKCAGVTQPDLRTLPSSFALDELTLTVDSTLTVDLSTITATIPKICIGHCKEVRGSPSIAGGQIVNVHVCSHQQVNAAGNGRFGLNLVRDVACEGTS